MGVMSWYINQVITGGPHPEIKQQPAALCLRISRRSGGGIHSLLELGTLPLGVSDLLLGRFFMKAKHPHISWIFHGNIPWDASNVRY